MLDLERSKMLDLNAALKRERQNLSNVMTTMESERNLLNEELEQERTSARQLKNTLEMMQVSVMHML